MSNYLILSCDGGGIRGYLSALILQRLNNDLQIFGSKNQNIDFYAGTSTGGLIALALAYGSNINDIVNFYATQGSQIFHPLGTQAHCLLSAGDKLRSEGFFDEIKEFWQVLYDNTGKPSLQSAIQSFVPGNPLLSALPNKVAVATFQLSPPGSGTPQWTPLVIDNLPGSASAATYLYDAALSTSAAPVYFPPYNHPTFGWCADGGIFANNPAPLAIARAIQAAGRQLSSIALLSIGTGFTNSSLPVSSSTRLCFGLKYWAWFETNPPTPAFPVLNAMFDGGSENNDYICRQLLGNNYARVNPVLSQSVPLDGYSPADLAILQKAATNYFNSPAWPLVEAWVKNIFHH
jgi:patatin-like phospholipase/acyl hydrolase